MLVAALVAVLTEGCDTAPEPEPPPPAQVRNPHRIVSLSPEVSRILLDLGVGDEIVAADATSRDLPGIADPVDLGELVARDMRARVVAARTAREVSEIATRRDGRSRLRVALVIRCDPPTVVGGAGLIHETLELAGAENVFHETGLEERTITGSELAERAPEIVFDASGAGPASPCFDAAAWGARVESLPTRLATLPAIDLVARVRSLHEILYPQK